MGNIISETLTLNGTTAVDGTKVHYDTMTADVPAGTGTVKIGTTTKIGYNGPRDIFKPLYIIRDGDIDTGKGFDSSIFALGSFEDCILDTSDLTSVADGTSIVVDYYE